MPPLPDDEARADSDHGNVSSTSVLWRQNEGITDDAIGPGVDDGAVEELWRSDGGGQSRILQGAHPHSYVALAAGLFLALLLLDGLYVGIRLRSSLRSAGAALQTAESALTKGDLTQAAASLTKARSSSNQGRGLTLHPSFVLASWIPGVGRDVRSLRALSDAARLSTDAGERLLSAVRTLGVPGGDIPRSLYENGRVRFGPIDRARPNLEEGTHLLAVAETELAAQHPAFTQTRALIRDQKLALARVLLRAQRADRMVRSLPSMLGSTNRRRYLLAFQALGEARGTGGVIGLYGVLSADQGRVHLTKVGYLGNLIKGALPSPVAAPRWFQRNYGPQFATRQWQQVNLSPNFPVVAKVLLNMYKAATGTRLDGVVAVDPVALQDLLSVTGPIKAPGLPPLSATNAAQLLLRDSYTTFPNRTAQNRFLAAVVHRFWRRLTKAQPQASTLGTALRKALLTQHLKVYSSTPSDQKALAQVGATGDLTSYGPNVQMIFNTNYSANKVDYYLRRKIHTTIRLTTSGDAVVQNTVTLHNYAPSGPPSPLLGPGLKGDPPGMNRMVLNFLVPPGAGHPRLISNGSKRFPLRYQDSGRPLFWTLLALRPGEAKTETFSYRLSGAAQVSGTSGEFHFVLYPQATVIPDQSWLTVVPPRGWKATSSRGAAIGFDGKVRVRGYFSTPESIEVRLSHS